KPARCQRGMVSALTTIKFCFHRDQYFRARTQKTLSNGVRRGRGCLRLKTRSCCRRATFSSQRLRREPERRINEVRTSSTVCNIATCYRGLPVNGNWLNCCKQRRTEIWRATGVFSARYPCPESITWCQNPYALALDNLVSDSIFTE